MDVPSSLGIIAGKGDYPLQLAASARRQGVSRLFAVAFRGETRPAIAGLVDDLVWLRVGQLQAMLAAFGKSGVKDAVMAGQITPTNLFRVRPDRATLELLSELRERNAQSIFAAIGRRLEQVGVQLRPAYLFMESAMPGPGLLSRRGPTEQERADIELGLKVARTTSGLEIGQTVVVKEGTILAVEAFEGTDETIRRAGKLGGRGAVVVKVAKGGHDMRFDIPVVGPKTLKHLRRAGVSALAVEAGRCILLDRDVLREKADRMNLCFVAVSVEEAAKE